ncbi:hypothetical protein JCM10914A_06880 [Paenibacillus sp. JCM 10914]|uniref:hypothetical protein n=1 Tax=Paenibacillus sp. JCM 10914 TaxID=1236974 RepID=UPI0009DFAFEF|nr:hypothetical protein [Paenibacillus sp. JCM 10914]
MDNSNRPDKAIPNHFFFINVPPQNYKSSEWIAFRLSLSVRELDSPPEVRMGKIGIVVFVFSLAACKRFYNKVFLIYALHL